MIEQCCFVLFEKKEDKFLCYILQEIPDICQYLYKTNDKGWFPLFRILDIFGSITYQIISQEDEN